MSSARHTQENVALNSSSATDARPATLQQIMPDDQLLIDLKRHGGGALLGSQWLPNFLRLRRRHKTIMLPKNFWE
ncbi:MAG: hypothetical protein MHMPM18_003746 [Marteilia pararefringens]